MSVRRGPAAFRGEFQEDIVRVIGRSEDGGLERRLDEAETVRPPTGERTRERELQ